MIIYYVLFFVVTNICWIRLVLLMKKVAHLEYNNNKSSLVA